MVGYDNGKQVRASGSVLAASKGFPAVPGPVKWAYPCFNAFTCLMIILHYPENSMINKFC